MQIGQPIRIEAFHADGTRYRWWWATAEIDEAGIRYVDYELDVSRRPPAPAVIVDEDELREAAERFGYSAGFRPACTEAAQEAVRLAEGWVPRGAPRPGGGDR